MFQRRRRFRATEPKVWVAAVTFGVWGSYGIMCKPIGSQLTRAEQCCATSRLFQDLHPHFSPLSLALLSDLFHNAAPIKQRYSQPFSPSVTPTQHYNLVGNELASSGGNCRPRGRKISGQRLPTKSRWQMGSVDPTF